MLYRLHERGGVGWEGRGKWGEVGGGRITHRRLARSLAFKCNKEMLPWIVLFIASRVPDMGKCKQRKSELCPC
jgi:hypothetical protein